MILGLHTFCNMPFHTPQSPLKECSYIEVKNCIVDDLHIRNTIVNINEKTEWDNSTIFHAAFNGDLEAGNITMRENKIVKLRLKRREVHSIYFRAIAEFPFEHQIMMKRYEHFDYEPRSRRRYEWIVTPVDESGIEGNITGNFAEPDFDGWWLIDLDHTKDYCFQFLYNLENQTIALEQDRSVMSTFSKYPIVRYGAKHSRTGTMKAMLLDQEIKAIEQVEKLNTMLLQHKSYLLKNGTGHRFIVDVFNPSEGVYGFIEQAEDIKLDWYEVGEIND